MQAPLLTWGPPVLQQWQRLLLLEEAACERDIASYSVFNVRLAAAVFDEARGAAAAGGGDVTRLRRYAITPWPTPPDEDSEVCCGTGSAGMKHVWCVKPAETAQHASAFQLADTL
jgi:hypothetical protein